MSRREKLPWFRFYTEAFSSPRMRRLKPETRWLFVAMIGAARESPLSGFLMLSERHAYAEADIADYAALSARCVASGLPKLAELGLIGWNAELGAWGVCDWDEKQFESDVSTERVRRFRERQRNVSGTAPENREQIQNLEQSTDHLAGGCGQVGEEATQLGGEELSATAGLALVRKEMQR